MPDEYEEQVKKKVASLDERIKAARTDQEEYEIQQYGVSAEESDAEKRGKRAAGEFLASVIAGFILGYVIDKYAGTAPAAMFIFMILGFVSGVMRANAVTKKNE